MILLVCIITFETLENGRLYKKKTNFETCIEHYIIKYQIHYIGLQSQNCVTVQILLDLTVCWLTEIQTVMFYKSTNVADKTAFTFIV